MGHSSSLESLTASLGSLLPSWLRRPGSIEARLLDLLARRYSLRLPQSDTPQYASGEDARAPWGILNRSGMISLAFEFMNGNVINGDYFEFGCWGARTFRLAYEHHRAHFAKKMHFWLFDSFRGLPTLSPIDQHPKWNAGDYRTSVDEFRRLADTAGVPRESYTVVPGFYSETLTAELAAELSAKTKAGLVYIDCDLYESTREALEFMYPFFQTGTVICFDDYYCFNGNPERGEQLAIGQFLHKHPGVTFSDYYNFGWHGKSFIVHLKTNGNGIGE